MHDVRVELSAAVELVLQVAEDLLGRRVVQAVALAAHGLADAEASELVPPPLVLVLPSHVRVQDRLRAGGQALLLPEVRTAAHVPGHDLLAGHVVHGSEVRLGAGDLELGDVGPEPGRTDGPRRSRVRTGYARGRPSRPCTSCSVSTGSWSGWRISAPYGA